MVYARSRSWARSLGGATALLLCVSAASAGNIYLKRATARETWLASTQALGEAVELGPWYYVGPFDSTNGAGFAQDYPPEHGVDLKATYIGKGGRTLRWLPGSQFTEGKTNSLGLFEDNDNLCVYLYRTLTAPTARELPILLGSDDTLTVWLNGEQVLANQASRACTLGDDRVKLKLRAGRNELLLKVCQGGGPSGFAFGLDVGADTLLEQLAADFPDEIDEFLREQDWLRQARATKLPAGVAISPEDDAPGGCDGVKDGGTGFHTQQEDQPWWQVDLGKPYALDHALLYNREDCASRIARVKLLLSDDGQQWRQVWQNDGTVFHGAKDGKPCRVTLTGQTARFVRLQLPGRDFLHLDEVEVFGSASPDTNLALNRPATESSSSPWSTYTPLKVKGVADAAAERALFHKATEEALDLAQRTWEFVNAARPLPAEHQRLDSLRAEVAAATATADWQALYLQVRRLRREIILQHPALDFDRLVVVKRGPPLYSHMVDQYEGRHSQAGDGLVLLRDWKTRPQATVLLQGQLPVGAVGHADLSYDARRIIFGFCDHTVQPRELRRFMLYEHNLDTGKVRQVTGVPGVDPQEGWAGRKTVLIEDFDPCYLPDGGIIFVSTRNQGFGRCHGGRYTPSYVLYRCEADGSQLKRLSYGEANEWNPSVLPDGRVLYTRWDYINRHDTVLQSLWTTRPDGTAVAHYYGNSTRNPCMVAQARAIPGSDLIVALAMAHHSFSSGSLFTVDRRRGEEGQDPIVRLTPESSFPETEAMPSGSYCDPWPLSANLYLASYDPARLVGQGNVASRNGYGVYLVDTLGGRELLYRDPRTCCFNPLAIQPRPMPPALPSTLVPGWTDGVFVIQNVYNSIAALAPGSVKHLRVVAMHEQPTASAAERSAVSQEIVKSVVGTVPVREDGSVTFRAPAQEPLLFQLLDENNVSLFSMRSQVYLQPGEVMSCAGCHEPRGVTPLPTRYARSLKPALLTPGPGPQYAGGFSFGRTVQPVLDRSCIRCHGLGERAGGMSLLGTAAGQFSESYNALIARPGMVALAYRNVQTDISKPGDYGARAGKLANLLLTSHREKAKLDAESFTRIAEWLDLNGQYYGDYSFQRPERRAPSEEGVKALRGQVRQSCGACHRDLADQPLAALVNVAQPDESRVLRAPLATTEGGWGQCRQLWPSTAEAGYTAMQARVLAATGTP